MRSYFQIEGTLRNNIGDVLQGEVARAFLPQDAEVVDRENLSSLDREQSGLLIANGWYMHSFDRFPAPESVSPIYVSVHIADSAMLRVPRIRAHLRKHAPIGCRDTKTKRLLLGWGIPAYYSGCLTITSDRRFPNLRAEEKQDECLLVDNVDHPVPNDVQEKLESWLGKKLVRITHDPPSTAGDLHTYHASAMPYLEQILHRYGRARLVITTKIHCALPCLGMGANVLMIHPKPSDPRLETVREFIDILSYDTIRKKSTFQIPTVNSIALHRRKNFLSTLVEAGVLRGTNPVENDSRYRLLRFRARLLAHVYQTGVAILRKAGPASERIIRVFGDA